MRDSSKANLEGRIPTTQMWPCTILTVTPLTVTLNGSTVPGMRVLGATYTVGFPAVALINAPNTPVILPIGA